MSTLTFVIADFIFFKKSVIVLLNVKQFTYLINVFDIIFFQNVNFFKSLYHKLSSY